MKKNQGLAVLIGVTLLSLGFVLGLTLLSPPAVPPSLALNESSPSYFTPIEQQLDDSRDVQLDISVEASEKVFSPTSGVVTRNACTEGAPIHTWDSTLSVLGNPLLNISTPTPMWRDIVSGDSGTDVLGIQEELLRQGLHVVVDGVAGPQTISLINSRLKELGGRITDSRAISKSSLLWLPSPVIYARSCVVPTGATVLEGEAVFDTQPKISALAVKDMPMNLVPGERTLKIAGNLYAVDETGRTAEELDLASLSRLIVRSETDSAPAGLSPEYKAQLVLSTSVSAWAVPPSSLIIEDAAKACVVDKGGRALAVNVISSQLGKTFIVFLAQDTKPVALTLKPERRHC